MPKFRVSVHGKDYKIGIVQRRFLFRKKHVWKQAGFYTTRFVESDNANEAIFQVFETLQMELERDGRTTENSSLELEEIQEDDKGFELYAPGTGYTFYTGDEAQIKVTH